METLILSAAYEPMGRVTWQRAMTLWFNGRVEVVETHAERNVRTVRSHLAMPAVVRFHAALRRRRQTVRFSRVNVFARDKGRCRYCESRVAFADATYDHVVPRARGGATVWNNVVISCLSCNQRKGNRTPEEARMRLHSRPVRPRYLPEADRRLSWQHDMPAVWRPYLAAS